MDSDDRFIDSSDSDFVVLYQHRSNITLATNFSIEGLLSDLSSTFPDFKILYHYSHLARFNIYGFVATLTKKHLSHLRDDLRILVLEEIKKVHVSTNLETVLSKSSRPLSQVLEERLYSEKDQCVYEYSIYERYLEYNSNRTGQGVVAYIVDTGIDSNHTELSSRTRLGFDVFRNESKHTETDTQPEDPHGHGTHIASIIGGRTIGLAKDVSLVDVRVLNRSGEGRLDDVIAGLDFIAGEISQTMDQGLNAGMKYIINLSFTGPHSQALNAVLSALSIAAVIVVAAGDDDLHSCMVSPSSASGVLSVGAIRKSSHTGLPGSNFGDCVHVLAPGEDIVSAVPTSAITNDDDDQAAKSFQGQSQSQPSFVRRSGSSVAAAVVSGMVAKVMGEALVYSDSLSNVVTAPVLRLLIGLPERLSIKSHPHKRPYHLCKLSYNDSAIPLLVKYSLESSIAAIKENAVSSIKENIYGIDSDKGDVDDDNNNNGNDQRRLEYSNHHYSKDIQNLNQIIVNDIKSSNNKKRSKKKNLHKKESKSQNRLKTQAEIIREAMELKQSIIH